ncbi:MAG: glycosyltransferase family A protein [Gilvibacter sp.]
MIQFTVVIAVYNKQKYLAETLASVLAQSYKQFEVVIVNDGSIDGSDAIITSFLDDERIHYYYQENQGVSAARNSGILKANHPYIAFLDADDLWETDYLETQAKLISSYPEEGCFATAQYMLEKGKKHLKNYSFDLSKGATALLNFFEASRQHPLIHSSAVVIKKELFDQIGMFNEGILTGEDTDLWIRIATKYQVAFCNHPCSVYRIVTGGLFTSSTDVNQLLDLEAYKDLEVNRSDVKRYLDLNRYAQAIQAKLWGQKREARTITERINLENLNGKQRWLLKLPKGILTAMFKLKSALNGIGIRTSSYS